MNIKKRFRIALALGGGGVRGLAHIGVLKVLISHSVPVDLIVGTSMGAIIGGAYCLTPDIITLQQKILEMLARPEIKRMESFFVQASEEDQQKFIIQKLLSKIKNLYLWNLRAAKKWLIRTEPISKLLENLFDDRRFSDVRIPFACVAVDLNTGTDVIIQRGRILDAVLASSSIPGIFPPLKQGSKLLVDGGILSLVPGRQARALGADFIIGVDLTPKYLKRELFSGLDVMFQADWIKSCYLNRLNLRYCDWIIRPEGVVPLNWSAFSQGSFCIKQGESAALRDIAKIKSMLIKKRRLSFLKKIFLRIGGGYVD